MFLLSPADVDVSAEERRRIAETGFYGPGFTTTANMNVNVTPEPATMALMAAGLAGVFGSGLRRRRRTRA